MYVIDKLEDYEKTFDVILTDPPWKYYGSSEKMGAAGKHYALMEQDDINHLPVFSLLRSSDSVVFIWTTSPMLERALETLDSWGLYYRGVAWNWVKVNAKGEAITAQGPRPSIVKSVSEFCLAGSPRRSGRPLALCDESIPQQILDRVEEEAILEPRTRKHSEKPRVHSYIDRMYPDAVKLEMFARSTQEGWYHWGNEL